MKKIFFLILIVLSIISCSSFKKDIVIERNDGLSKRPKWVKESQPFTSGDGFLYFLGQVKIPATKANIAMGYRIAENNAKNTIASTINQNLTYMLQNAEEGLDVSTNQVQFVSTESAKAVMNNVLPSDRYWEKVLSTVNAEGEKEMFYLIFARIKVKETDLKKIIERQVNGNKGISEDFKKKVDQQWDAMVKDQYPEL